MSTYKPYPDTEAARLWYMQNMRAKLQSVATQVGVSPAEVAQQAADTENYEYLVSIVNQTRITKEALSEFKRVMLTGPAGLTPDPPTFEQCALPEAGSSGIVTRNRELSMRIKKSAGFNDTIGELFDMIVMNPQPEPEGEVVPKVRVDVEDGGKLIAKYTRGKFDGAHVYIRRPGEAEYTSMGNFPASPAVIEVKNPTNAPEVIEVRIKLLKGNVPASSFSPAFTVITRP